MSHALRQAAGGELLCRRTAKKHQRFMPASSTPLPTKPTCRSSNAVARGGTPFLPCGPLTSRAALRSLEEDSFLSATLESSVTSESDGELASTSSSLSSSSLPLAPPSSSSASPSPPPSSPRSGLFSRRSSSSSSPSPSSLIPVDVEPAPSNSRRLYASVDIAAPSFVVWSALTNYEKLGDFIPGLAENRCLARTSSGATLLQVGEQSVALGLRFRARVVLDIQEHEQGLPASLWGGGDASSSGSSSSSPSSSSSSSSSPFSDDDSDSAWARSAAAGLFPQPRSGLAPSPGRVRDISFALIEGDFAAFRGVWRVQYDRSGAISGGGAGEAATAGAMSTSSSSSSSSAAPSGPRTRLSYALYVRPQPWLPVHLVQARIRAEVAANLDAVRAHTERVWRGE